MAVNRTINISRIRSTLMFCSCPVTIESSDNVLFLSCYNRIIRDALDVSGTINIYLKYLIHFDILVLS